MLDTIIRTLSLTFVDMEDPACARFSPRSVPSVASASQSWATNTLFSAGADNTHSPYTWQGCSCTSRSLAQRWAGANEYTPLWLSSPGWDHSWSEAETRKEICRRLCWSTLLLVAGHTSYVTSANRSYADFFVLEPANVCIPPHPCGSTDLQAFRYRCSFPERRCAPPVVILEKTPSGHSITEPYFSGTVV